MARHNDFGSEGETLAANWLEKHGFFILARNWRSGHHEIDIAAVRDGVLHIVEVKTRSDDRFGLPEEFVDARKGRFITKAGVAFQSQFRRSAAEGTDLQKVRWHSVQYDIISILHRPCAAPEIFFIEDVYWWG